MRTSPPIERLVAALKRLPGIGEKSAARLAFFLLGAPDALVQDLAAAIGRLLDDPAARAAQTAAATQLLANKANALTATLDLLRPILTPALAQQHP